MLVLEKKSVISLHPVENNNLIKYFSAQPPRRQIKAADQSHDVFRIRKVVIPVTHSLDWPFEPGGGGGRAFETLNTKHFKNDCKPLKALVNTFKTLFVLLSKKTLIYSISEAGRLQCCKNFFF